MDKAELVYYKKYQWPKFIIPRAIRRGIKKIWSARRWPIAYFKAWPDFCIIGQMKSGTSSLYHYLCEHPDVLPAKKKEINYFNFDYDLGTLHYRSHFPFKRKLLNDSNGHRTRLLTGEATPEYLLHPHAAKRCFSLLPNLKIIALLRNPIDRAFSHYRHGRRYGWEPCETFEEAIEAESTRIKGEHEKMLKDDMYYSFKYHHYTYLERGKYIEQLIPWYDSYPKNQILIINSDQFYANIQGEYNRTLQFLGLKKCELSSYPNMFVGPKGKMSTETRQQLQKYFAPYNEKLYQFIGERFDW